MMSVVIAIKENNQVYVACDTQVTRGSAKSNSLNPNNFKLWHPSKNKEVIIGSSGSVRVRNIIQSSRELNEKIESNTEIIDYFFVINEIVPLLFKLQKQNDIELKVDGFPTLDISLIIVVKNKIYHISSYGDVMEVDHYIAIGSGQIEVNVSLLQAKELEVKKRLIQSIKNSESLNLYVSFPIIIGSNQTLDFEIFESEESYDRNNS